MALYYDEMRTPVGMVTMVASDEALKMLWFSGFSRSIPEGAVKDSGQWVIRRTRKFLEDYFAGSRPDPASVPIDPDGTEFQKLVWALIRAIPYGETRSYGQVAAQAAEKRGKLKMSAQAIGQAARNNPLCILTPCHRVVGANGNPGGYGGPGGLRIKAALLALEGYEL